MNKSIKTLNLIAISLTMFSCTNNEQQEPEINLWPTEQVQTLIKQLLPNNNEVLPSYTDCESIEIESDSYLIDGFFGIFCKGAKSNAEAAYKASLENAGWNVSTVKNFGDMWEATSPLNEIWINYVYNDLSELEIYVTKTPITNWPTQEVADAVNKVVPNTETTIPAFSASNYVVTYYEQYHATAINGYGVDLGIVETYKQVLENNSWNVSKFGEEDYMAISPNEDVKINFYYNDERNEFNVDVFKNVAKSTAWPALEISVLLNSLGITGTVPEYTDANQGFQVDNEYNPPAVFVFMNGGYDAAVTAYNQKLVSLGYQVIGNMYNEPVYNLAGTTLGLRATYLTGNCITIELFDINEITQ